MRSLTGTLDKLLGVGRRDHRDALVGFSILLLAMAGHAMLETARDALFLSALGASRLPWAYLTIAISTLLLARWYGRQNRRFMRRRGLQLTLGIGALVTACFSLVSAIGGGSALVLPFYVWTGLLATVVVVQFWLLLGEVLDFGQAKRVFALIGSGGLLGAVAGSLLASGILMFVRAQWLPLFAAGLFAMASGLPAYLSPARPSAADAAEQERDAPSPLALLARDAYLRRLLLAVLLGTLTVTIADYLFKSTVAREVEASQLGSFFGRYYAIVNAAALLVQLVVAPHLLRTIGVHRAVQLMPAALLTATLGFVALPGLAAALVLKASDGSLRHSVNRVSQEILFLPLGRQLRSSFRVFTEAVGLRMGQALASILVLAAIALELPTRSLGGLLLVLVASWLAVTLIGLERLYVERFRQELRRGTLVRPTRGVDLDRRSIALLETALGSDDDAEVLAALDVYQAYEKTHLVPALILYHPSARVVLRALELLKREPREDVLGVAGRLLSHPDPEVRAALLRLYVAGNPEIAVLERLRDDSSDAVRATALAGLLHAEQAPPSEAARELTRIADRGSHLARHAVALMLPVLPRPLVSSVVGELSTRNDPELQKLLSKAIAEAPSPETIPAAIRLLANGDARAFARDALCALGDPALDALERALADHGLPQPIRRHLPRTISRFASPRAAEILERGLFVEEDPVVRHKILRGLGQMRADDPRLPVDRQRLLALARQLLDRVLTVYTLAELLEVARRRFVDPDDAGAELLSAALSDEGASALEHAFRVLHIAEPTRELELVHRALTSDDPDVRARGRELAEHVVPESLRPRIRALVDDDEHALDSARHIRERSLPAELVAALDAERRLTSASDEPSRERERRFRRALARALALLRHDQSRPLAAIVEHHLIELGLASLGSDAPHAVSEEASHVP